MDVPLRDELRQGRRPIKSKGDCLAGLAQPQHGIQAGVEEVMKVILVLGCTETKDDLAAIKSQVMRHSIYQSFLEHPASCKGITFA